MDTVAHYKAYRTPPFTRRERDHVTVMFGGLTWKHERLIQGAVENLGYRAQPLPGIRRADLETGKELTDVGACCPTTFTTGNLANFLRQRMAAEGKEQTIRNYVYLTAGSCGPCRFGQYHESYAMALQGLGMERFRMFLLDQYNLETPGTEGSGIEITLPLTLGIVWSGLMADLLTELEYMTRPYEVIPGETDRVLRESVEQLYRAFRDRPTQGGKAGTVAWYLTTGYFKKAMRAVRKKWDEIEVDRLRIKPRVKITGEFWLQTHEGDGNYNIKRWLEQEGAEVVPPPLMVWPDYNLYSAEHRMEERRAAIPHYRLKRGLVRGLRRWLHHAYNGLRHPLNDMPRALPSQEELARLAAPYYHRKLDGGEGHMLVGKALHALHHKTAHMICELSPYSCMPNTMSVGAMANALGRHPDLLYAPIEVKGDADVHALSRCQMILTDAKVRAHAEFEQALIDTGLTPAQLREIESAHPEVTRATYRIPHGVAGMAANYAHHLLRIARGEVRVGAASEELAGEGASRH
jgi:predicted nucleotide-binding protein (sugar kinase/HSP70/actin superfamily)